MLDPSLTLSTDLISDLYRRYSSDLRQVRHAQRKLYRQLCMEDSRRSLFARATRKFGRRLGLSLPYSGPMRPQLDDISAEVTYLLLRATAPECVVEISPCGGWSTTWILRAIRDNGAGHLFSFDLIDLAQQNVPLSLSRDVWTFVQGDVKHSLSKVPARIDYLFMDSDHSASFAHWYIQHVVPRVTPSGVVSVDDVYHFEDPGAFDGEGRVVVDWLNDARVPYWTASPAKAPAVFTELTALRKSLDMLVPIHHSVRNSTLFFRCAGLASSAPR